jgi:hypothetical protein
VKGAEQILYGLDDIANVKSTPKDAVARHQHDIAITERREGEEREVKDVVVGLDCAEPD